MESETKIVRLNSGEEIVAKVTHSGDSIRVEDPLILVPTSQRAIALAPWLPYTTVKDEGIEIPVDRVMFIANPHPEMEKEYTSAITGLVVPDKEVVGAIGSDLLTED